MLIADRSLGISRESEKTYLATVAENLLGRVEKRNNEDTKWIKVQILSIGGQNERKSKTVYRIRVRELGVDDYVDHQ